MQVQIYEKSSNNKRKKEKKDSSFVDFGAIFSWRFARMFVSLQTEQKIFISSPSHI